MIVKEKQFEYYLSQELDDAISKYHKDNKPKASLIIGQYGSEKQY